MKVEEPVRALDIAGGAEAYAPLALGFLGVEGFWMLMGFGICTKLELAVIVEFNSCSYHDGAGGEGVGYSASDCQAVQR